jgi:hypothetical protein
MCILIGLLPSLSSEKSLFCLRQVTTTACFVQTLAIPLDRQTQEHTPDSPINILKGMIKVPVCGDHGIP